VAKVFTAKDATVANSVLTDADESQGGEIATYFEQMRSVFGRLLLKDAAPRSRLFNGILFVRESVPKESS